jgi:hypothetical protein
MGWGINRAEVRHIRPGASLTERNGAVSRLFCCRSICFGDCTLLILFDFSIVRPWRVILCKTRAYGRWRQQFEGAAMVEPP